MRISRDLSRLTNEIASVKARLHGRQLFADTAIALD
jgi:hypothetical protein